tara:strand:- start:503 stop:2395 length:1893 start_codon:yes stop_codon:yes gene_type:complete
MYPNILFSEIASQTNIDLSPLDRLHTPAEVLRRNDYSWAKIEISLKEWVSNLQQFKACYEDIKNPDLPRVRRQLAKKNSIKISQKLRPLIEVSMHTKWLEVESAVCRCMHDDDILSASMMIRALLEEADRCQLIAKDIKTLQSRSLKYSEKTQEIMDRLYFWVLPRLKPRTKREIKTPVPRKNYGVMDERLVVCMSAINDYVHPNYGSHVVLLRPLESQAIEIIKKCLIVAYSIFFEINWLCRIGDQKPKSPIKSNEVNLDGITDVLSNLLATATTKISSDLISVHFDCLITQLKNENNFKNNLGTDGLDFKLQDTLRDTIKASEKDVNQLILSKADSSSIALAAIRLFNVQSTLKIVLLRNKSLEYIMHNNVLAAAVFARAVIEHYAIENWVLEKSASQMTKFIKSANNKYIENIEKKLAKCLVGSKNSLEYSNAQKEYWDVVYGQQKINLMACIEISADMFSDSYDYLSGVIHGLVITGGDLIGGDHVTNLVKTQTYFFSADALGQVCAMDFDKAGKIFKLSHKLHHMAKASESDFSEQKIANSLKVPDVFKHGRDFYGDGSKNSPFSFRPGLHYFAATRKLLRQLKPDEVYQNQLERLDDQIIIDKYILENAGSLYFQTKNYINISE